MNEVRDIIHRNVQELRGDVIRMVGGEILSIELSDFDVEKETEFVNGCELHAAKHACYKFASVNIKSAHKTEFWEEMVSGKDEILSAMVVYGFLSYYNGQLRIPNHELFLKFKPALVSQEPGLKQTLNESKRLLNATLDQEVKP